MAGLPDGSVPNTLAKSYSISAEVEVPEGGGEGMLNTLGGRFGGYGLYLAKGKPVFTYNFLGLEKFRWEGKEALARGQAYHSYLTSNMTVPAWPRAALASFR